MSEGSSIAGLGIEVGLGFGGESQFGVGLWLMLRPRSLYALSTQQGSGIREGLHLGHKGLCRSGSVFVCQAHTRRSAPGRGGLRNPLVQLQPGLRNDMVSFQVPC